ncbi:MAG: hypothetical protein QM762_29080 [Chryseolinea sp.]
MNGLKSLLLFLLLAIGVFNFRCSGDEVVPKDQEPFSGDWRIAEVTYDGMIQTEWVGNVLSFTRLTSDSGTYKLPNSLADSIWSSIGSWKEINQKSFYREDQIEVRYYHEPDNQRMILDFYLPWTQQSTCENGICTLMITGQWTFTLKR